jgi:hypothetical protein
MQNVLRHITSLVVILIVAVGCSHGSNNPIMPRETGNTVTESQLPEISDGNILDSERNIDLLPGNDIEPGSLESIGMFGAYQLNLNKEELTAELVAGRNSAVGESYMVSGMHYFDIRPCSDCIKVKSIQMTPEGYVQLAFSASHPFPKGTTSKPPSGSNRLDLDVFDLALVVNPISASSTNYSFMGIRAYNGFCANTDGFTRELNSVTSNSSACPYFLVVDNSETATSDYNKFEMGSKDVSFDTYFISGGNYNLYLTMGYGSSAKKNTRLNPTYYNPEFNRKAAWKVSVSPPQGSAVPEIGNTWDDHDSTTPYNVTVKVWDWQQNSTVASTYPDPNHRDQILKSSKVSRISIEIPNMNSILKTTTTPQSGTGTPTDPLIYVIPIANELKIPAGKYNALVKVTDERIPPASINPGTTDAIMDSPDGTSQSWKSMPEFATYQLFTATVVVGKVITVTQPNGLEMWTVGTSADVKWTTKGPVTNVKIDLSMDGGLTFPVAISASTPNDGLYTIPSVGVWTSAQCRIKISDASEPAIMDISDNDFGVNCPLAAAPLNIAATDGTYYDKVRITWTARAGATGYNVYRNGTLKQANVTATQYDDMNPTPGTIFYYKVSTINICGEGAKGPADPGEPGNACVLPSYPTNISATDGTYNDKVRITWTAVSGATAYNVYRNGTIKQSNVTVTQYDDTSAVPGTVYYYQVSTINTCGEGSKGPADPGEPGNACVLPSVPTNLNASDGTSTTQVSISWTAGSLATTYNIYRNSTLLQSGVSGTSWNDTTVTRGVLYSYEVESQNTCGKSTTKAGPDTGYALGCTGDSDNSCSNATKLYYFYPGVNGCADQIDEDWYYFYVAPNGSTSSSLVSINSTSAPVNIYVYGTDPGESCPGTLITSLLNKGSGAYTVPATTKSRIFIKLTGASGIANYQMGLSFVSTVTNIPIELYVSTTTGTSGGTWPTGLTHAVLLQMVSWANSFFNTKGWNLVWDGSETFIPASYYTLDTATEDIDMHVAWNSGGAKLCLYYVNQLYNGNTAYCRVSNNPAAHNATNIFMVYSPNVYTWQNSVAHEDSHAFGYLLDTYFFDMYPCACADNPCLAPYLGYSPNQFADSLACFNGDQMYYADPSKAWSWYSYTFMQQAYTYEFNYTYSTNFPCY